MKATLFLFAAIIVTQVTFAEAMLQKGSIEYGGSVSYLRRNYKETYWQGSYHRTIWETVPQFGYFIRNGLSVGFDILYRHSTWKYAEGYGHSNGEYSVQDLAAGPRITYYFQASSKHTPFVVLGARVGEEIWKYEEPNARSDESTTSYTDVHLGVGILNVVNQYVAITTSLTFTAEDFHYKTILTGWANDGTYEYDSSGNRLTLDIGLKLFQPPSNK